MLDDFYEFKLKMIKEMKKEGKIGTKITDYAVKK